VDEQPAQLGVNTFVKYGGVFNSTELKAIGNQRNSELLTDSSSTPQTDAITSNEDASDKFFGKDDDKDKDENGKPKECS
jgi:hypothetical protein